MRIVDVATSIEPGALVSLRALRQRCCWSERNQRIFERFFGLRSVCRHDGTNLKSLLFHCLCRLVTTNKELLGSVDYLIYSHSLHSTVPLDHSFLESMASEALNCRPETLSLTQGSCASGLLSVRLLLNMMSAGVPKRAILLTGEKCFHPTAQYVDQHGIFGEAVTATYFSNHVEDAGIAVSSIVSRTLGGHSTCFLAADVETRNRYDREFIPMMLATIEAAADDAKAPMQQIAAILPYHVSPPTFDRLAHALKLPLDIVVRTNLYDVGHCFCGDAFINLRSWRRHTRPCASRPFLLALAAGITGTFAAMILKVEEDYAYLPK